ncbi:outer membrane protein assembly factor BamA [Suttonella ornithocola]|nr:outer membrane protein assembly factor BamA [Suttonella ornithocola]
MIAFRPSFISSAIALCFTATAVADSFVVRDIRVEGLQRVSAGTVFNYLPVKVGEKIDLANSAKAVTDLYASNLFSNINLARDGNVLVVQVKEYPVISSIELSGNTTLNSSNIKEAFAKSGFAEGQAFNPAMLQEIENELYKQYQVLNKYQIKITPTVTNLPRGRVAIKFDISEGRTAQIKDITFIGNKVYSNSRLRKLLDTSTTGWLSFMSKNDQINGEKLQQDLKRLSDFYHDRGFYDFKIISTHTSLSSDKTKAFLTITLQEGQPYIIKDYTLSGNLVIPEAEIRQLIKIKSNDVYNRKDIETSVDAIKTRLADEGYAQADVNIIPDIDKLTRQIMVNLVIVPGNRIMVRRIEFIDNQKSYDSVLRRELRQQEMTPYSASDIERSEQRIRRLPQVEQIDKTLVPVKGHPDQVDIVYTIKERSTSYIQGGVGYGQSSGALFNIEYTDDNFFGSGNRFNINFGKGSYQETYGLNFTNPYFTDDGISASFEFNYAKYDYDDGDLSDWTSDNLSAIVTFGYPISEYQNIYLGGGYRQVKIHTGKEVATEISDYLKENGSKYDEYVLKGSWVRDTTDDAYLPTVGTRNAISIEGTTPGSDLTYYRTEYKNRSYFSSGNPDSLVFSLHGNISYGNGYGNTKGGLPFYRHYYAGGIDTIRGYKYGSVGPRYKNGDYAGGDFRVIGGAELIMPISFNERSRNLRVGAFVDGGYVWSKFDDAKAKDIRYSAGVFINWISPIGPLNLSYGVPLNKKEGDKRESFQFTLGTSF